MIIDSRTSTPTEPTIIDSLLDPRELKDLAEFGSSSVVSECADVHGITGQELPLSVGILNSEHPE